MENVIIYVAGDPDAYPMEYYDEVSGSYQGMIPELLREFGRLREADVRYYEPEKGDQRHSLAEYCQVDLITCRGGTELFRHRDGGEVLLLSTEQDGVNVEYQLLVTEAAPENLAGELRSFLSEVSVEARTGLLIEAAGRGRPVGMGMLYAACFGAVIAILLLVGAIAALIRHYRRRLRCLDQDRETDAVTGIGNKLYLEHSYAQYIHDRNKILYRLLYIFVDAAQLDRQIGRAMTDEYLRHIAATLKDHAGDMDILARVSDSGFVLLRVSMDDREEQEWLRPVFERFRNAPLEGQTARRRFYAVGSYQLRQTDRDLDSMICDVSQCAQSAYVDGEEFRICTDAVIEALAAERLFRADVQNGLKNREFLLYLQPYVDVRTGRIAGGEALSRWEHPGRGLLLPADFLPFMERERLMPQLDSLCLENACEYLETVCRTGDHFFFISCNVSETSFSSADFVENCRKVIERYHFPRERILLELKEQGAIREAGQIKQNMKALKQMGVSIALDDFGTLFSSFANMDEIPLDVVKISKKLVEGIGARTRDAVLHGMIQVCHELGIQMIAEGVETREQADFLRAQGCNLLQGFYFYRPLPETEVQTLSATGGETSS